MHGQLLLPGWAQAQLGPGDLDKGLTPETAGLGSCLQEESHHSVGKLRLSLGGKVLIRSQAGWRFGVLKPIFARHNLHPSFSFPLSYHE
jgi:hypothetical protein